MSANWNNSFASSSRSHQPPPPIAHVETNGHVLHAPVLVLNASYAVSYTHLDVYKRQGHHHCNQFRNLNGAGRAS